MSSGAEAQAPKEGPRPPTAHATIVVTTCDRPEVATRAVASALRQSEPRVEVLVVDDGVRDRVPMDMGDDRVRVIRTEGRIGVSRARNVGLAEAKAPWVSFLDDDDELLPTMVEEALAAARGSSLPPPVAVVAGMEELDPEGFVLLTRIPVSMPRGRHYFLEDVAEKDRRGLAAYNTLFAPVDVVRGIGGFDEQMVASMHLDLMLRLNAACSIQAVPRVGYRMYHHAEFRLSKQYRHRAESARRTHAKHREAFRQHPRMEGMYLARTGTFYLRAGEWLRPLGLTVRAFLRAPRRPRAMKQVLLAAAGPRFFAWYEARKTRRAGGIWAPTSDDVSGRAR